MVLGHEHILPARLALAARDRPHRIEPPRDRRYEALLRLDVGRHRTKHRWLLLVRSICPPEALDRGIRFPSCLEQIVNAPPLVLGAEIGMIGAARSPGLREDKDALLVVHEGVGLANVRTAGAGLDRNTHISVVARPRDNATRAPRHLGDRLGPEMLDDLLERARHRS